MGLYFKHNINLYIRTMITLSKLQVAMLVFAFMFITITVAQLVDVYGLPN